MDRTVYKIEDILPSTDLLGTGEFALDNLMYVDLAAREKSSGLFQAHVKMSGEVGSASAHVLYGSHFMLEDSQYDFMGGFNGDVTWQGEFIQLHFQLEGGLLSMDFADINLGSGPGEGYCMYLPAYNGRFTVEQPVRGASFQVGFPLGYFSGLAARHPSLFEPMLESIESKGVESYSSVGVRTTPQMLAVIQSLRGYQLTNDADALMLEAKMLELTALHFKQSLPVAPHPISGIKRIDIERMHEAKSLLIRRMTDPPTLSELAVAVGTNEFALKRNFRKIFGTTPHAYLRRKKLELVRTYIQDTDLTIAEISYRVGYSDPAHLTNAFRKHFGMTPSAMRGA